MTTWMLHPLIVFTLVGSTQEPDCVRIPDPTRIEVVGRFSDMRYTEEHAYGHVVELWRAGGCLFGLLVVSEGLAGDTPVGELNDVRYDPATGALSFTAKLTMGVTQARGSTAWVPSRDLFQFTGRLRGKVLKGKLRRSDPLTAEARPVGEDIVLRRDPEQEAPVIAADRYGEWRKTAESILRFRGPKW